MDEEVRDTLRAGIASRCDKEMRILCCGLRVRSSRRKLTITPNVPTKEELVASEEPSDVRQQHDAKVSFRAPDSDGDASDDDATILYGATPSTRRCNTITGQSSRGRIRRQAGNEWLDPWWDLAHRPE